MTAGEYVPVNKFDHPTPLFIKKGYEGKPGRFQFGGLFITVRELEILTLDSQGLNCGRIAAQLGIARSTVKDHLHQLKRANLKEENSPLPPLTTLVAQALELGLLNPTVISELKKIDQS